jgi:hypothetical protein
MFLMGLDTARVRWDDTADPPAATWTNVSADITSRTSFDPILWTDRATGRTFVAQLAGEFSLTAFTDDDGGTWTTTQPPSAFPAFDHQTIGGGVYPSPVANPVYPSQVWYCAQFGVSECARSDTGGLTWSAPLPMNVGKCGGLHGHVVVDLRGSIYVPNGGCFDAQVVRRQGLIVSDDNGLTWDKRIVTGTLARTDGGSGDPGIAFDAANRLYFMTRHDGRAVVVTSDDEGRTWNEPVDVGAPYGIRNTEFTMAVAGDAGRAAVAFLGSTRDGNDQKADFTGVWHLYASVTDDGGTTWDTVDITPDDPVQRGCIWMRGGGNPCRNLLDFQGMTLDTQGRILIGYSDGCTTEKCLGPDGIPDDSRDSLGTIARQTSGRLLHSGDE